MPTLFDMKQVRWISVDLRLSSSTLDIHRQPNIGIVERVTEFAIWCTEPIPIPSKRSKG